ncbi:hypothetical protein J6TS2_25600 [Heyndrickxia sporothermodurans]|nr:hypothetical protein J6TS2_25600 [Heyndrickxia sporothermodurans]
MNFQSNHNNERFERHMNRNVYFLYDNARFNRQNVQKSIILLIFKNFERSMEIRWD